MELSTGIGEAFGDDAEKGEYFKKTGKRINRCSHIMNEYQQEISTMVDLESVKSSVKGNDIFLTLTVITLLYTPIAALGALWGMGFKFMPELNESFGYLFSLLFIFANVVLFALYFKKKNWLNSTLKGKSSGSS